MPRAKQKCDACGKDAYGLHCIECAILLGTRKPNGKAGDPRSGAFKRHHTFGETNTYHNTARAVAPYSSWLNRPRDGFTDYMTTEVPRMRLSTFGQRTSAVIGDV
jgi:hypothetical protein